MKLSGGSHLGLFWCVEIFINWKGFLVHFPVALGLMFGILLIRVFLLCTIRLFIFLLISVSRICYTF